MITLSELLYTDLHVGYVGENWIDVSFKDTLTSITHDVAFWQPPADVHSIAAIVCHVIAWRKGLIEVMSNKLDWKVDQEPSFDVIAFGDTNAQGWNNIKQALEDTQQQLELLVKGADAKLFSTVPNREYDHRFFISGITQHDAYHLGQIVILEKQAKAAL